MRGWVLGDPLLMKSVACNAWHLLSGRVQIRLGLRRLAGIILHNLRQLKERH